MTSINTSPLSSGSPAKQRTKPQKTTADKPTGEKPRDGLRKKPNGTWLARVYVNGQRQSKVCRTKREASQWRTDTESKLRAAGRPLGKGPEKTTLAEALVMLAEVDSRNKKGRVQEVNRINRWLSACGLPRLKLVKISEKVYEIERDATLAKLPRTFEEFREQRLERTKKSDAIRADLALMSMAEIMNHDIKGFENSLRDAELKADTIRLEIALLKHLFIASRDEWNWVYKSFPFGSYKMPKPGEARKVRLPQDKVKRLFEELAKSPTPHLLQYVELAIETTMRRGEVLFTATWGDVDLMSRTIHLKDDKAGGGRHVPLTKRAVEILEQLPRRKDDETIFTLTGDSLQCGWKTACKLADVKGLRIHDLRHEGISRHAKATKGNLPVIMKISGHRTPAMAMRYIHMSNEDVLEVMDSAEDESRAPRLNDIRLTETVAEAERGLSKSSAKSSVHLKLVAVGGGR